MDREQGEKRNIVLNLKITEDWFGNLFCQHEIVGSKSLDNAFKQKISKQLGIDIENKKEIPLDAWKGKSGLYVSRNIEEKIFICIEYRKDKHTLEITECITIVPEEKVMNIWKIICEQIEYTPTIHFKDKKTKEKYRLNYRNTVKAVIDFYNLPVSINGFNGGDNRAKHYFPYYYYPLKVVEFYNNIHYTRNTIFRLTKELQLEKEEKKNLL